MSHNIDVVYGNYNTLDVSDIVGALESKLKSLTRLGRIRYIFVSDNELLRINQERLNHDYYTDIITFDYSKRGRLSGEIYISIDRVEENALVNANELVRVMSHGLLHLLGFKDGTVKEKKEMREKEEEWINFIVSRES